MKTTLKLKINMLREYLGLFIYPQKPSAGLPQSRETIPLKTAQVNTGTFIILINRLLRKFSNGNIIEYHIFFWWS
jgi:hypothetical protein